MCKNFKEVKLTAVIEDDENVTFFTKQLIKEKDIYKIIIALMGYLVVKHDVKSDEMWDILTKNFLILRLSGQLDEKENK